MSAGPWRIDEDGFLISSEDQTDSAYDANDAARLLNVLTAQVAEFAATISRGEDERIALEVKLEAAVLLLKRQSDYGKPWTDVNTLLPDIRAFLFEYELTKGVR